MQFWVGFAVFVGFAVDDFKRLLVIEYKDALAAVGFFVVVLGTGVGVHQFEVHALWITALLGGDGIQTEAVIAQGFAAFDVVLIFVGPVQYDFFALLRDSVGAVFVDATGEKVTFVIVAVKEGNERVVDFAFFAGEVKVIGELFL